MKTGDIVYLKKDAAVLGEIVSLNEVVATVALLKSGLEITVALSELGATHSYQPERKSGTVVHILGVPYKILIIDDSDYRYVRDDADGWCDTSTKEILVFNFTQSVESKRDLNSYQRKIIRHEIIHAFLYESGVAENSMSCSAWAKNEEMVDWMAIQMPKILEAFKEADCGEEVGCRVEGDPV